ncbi:hypothetical protein COT57_02505 [Candidatus Micrarchaeota archaeon CG09_land_8_20_14_0_10_55_25]|nr:MAG: hypothetical protein COT57_02505 [Candidatus Micrarchaeota archaeon CG09_land_8_20_14_0_10_55_25]
MKRIVFLLNYPLQNQVDVGHLDVLMQSFKNALNKFDEAAIISPRDNREYRLGKKIRVKSNGFTNPLLYYLSPLKDFWTLWRLACDSDTKLIRAFAPTSGFVAGLVGKLTGKPVFLSVHTDEAVAARDSGRRPLKSLLVRFAEPLSLKWATKIGVISEHIREYAVRRGADPKKVFLHHNFVDLKKFKPGKGNNKRFVFVGRFTAVKAPLTALKAFKELGEGELWMIGDGPQFTEAKRIAGKNVRFFGSVPHSGLPAILAKCDYFIAPATAGFTLIEAFACGLPAAAADLDWTKEMVVNGKTGYLCKAYDADSLAAAMKKLLKNGVKMRAACVKKSREFSLKEFKKRELKVYGEIIGK